MKHPSITRTADSPQAERSALPDPSLAQSGNGEPAQLKQPVAMHQRLLHSHNAMGASGTTGTGTASRAPVDVLASLSSKTPPVPRLLSRQHIWLLAPVLLGTALWWGLPALWTSGSRLSIQRTVPPDPAPLITGRAPVSAETPAPAVESPHLAPVVATVISPEAATTEALRQAVEQWRQAWAARDVDAYLAHYAQSFVPANGQSRAKWADNRRRIIARQSDIALSLSHVELQAMGADRWQARFLQDYTTDSFSEKQLPKRLDFVREDGRWRIAAERSGPG